MSFKRNCVYIFFSIFFLCSANLSAQLTIVPDRENATYTAGEQMHFVCNTHITGTYRYTIYLSVHTKPIAEGNIYLEAGNEKKIPFKMEEPGHVYCKIKIWTHEAITGVVFSPWEIKGSVDTPSDFNSFWASQRALLDNIPINAVVTPFDTSDYSISYKMRLDNIEGRKVWGYISVPNGPGPFAGIITMPPFGIIGDIVVPETTVAERGGAISITLSIHDDDPEVDSPDGYMPDNYWVKEENYYRYGLLGAVRAIDYLFTRPDFDGESVGITGVSQGGGLSIVMTGVDPRIKAMAFTVGTMCGHSEFNYEKASGLPYYLRDSKGVHGTVAHENATIEATQYYDGIHCLKQFQGPVYGSISYLDTISPPGTVFAALNSLEQERVILHAKDLSHWTAPQYETERLAFFKKQFPSMIDNSSWPWSDPSTGKYINAGLDQVVNMSTTVSLSGELGDNGIPNTTIPVKWAKASGPGKVSFSNPQSRNTDITFSAPGTYKIKLFASDESILSTDQVFYSLHDFVTIQVGP